MKTPTEWLTGRAAVEALASCGVGTEYQVATSEETKSSPMTVVMDQRLCDGWRTVFGDGTYTGIRCTYRITRYVPPVDADGWVTWEGGECPVDDPETLVEYRLAHECEPRQFRAGALNWGKGTTLIAYRIVQPAASAEPVTGPAPSCGVVDQVVGDARLASFTELAMTFDELFAQHSLTANERAELVAYLASLRMLATLRALMEPNSGARHD